MGQVSVPEHLNGLICRLLNHFAITRIARGSRHNPPQYMPIKGGHTDLDSVAPRVYISQDGLRMDSND